MRWTICCDYSDAFNASTHTLEMPMSVAQSRQVKVELIQGSSSAGITQWRQAVRGKGIGP